MYAAVEWSNFQLAAAFVIGAGVATIAVLRVVRAVATMFAQLEERRRRPPPDDDE